MALHYVNLKLGNKSFKSKVSTQGCTFVADLLGVIKTKFSRCLDSYSIAQLTLFRPDGITEIDPETLVTDLREIPWEPMIVTVEELPTPARSGSSKKQGRYKWISTEASCRKFLNALAIEIGFDYNLPKTQKKPTMDDVLAAKDGRYGKPENSAPGVAWWDYKKEDGIQFTTTPLPSILSSRQWDILKSLNRDTSQRIHDARLPLTSRLKPFIILPHKQFTTPEYVDELKSIATIIGVVHTDEELVVKDEFELFGSSSSEPESPDMDKNMK
ncbi:hypothetical protein MIR68_007110 [Amoeboaphelidium protococcarum]|nr:hypothetical protein MIR68_007110 [Amoeboaphelidium protococcarum]KAI3652659.1 hypothetical protein MP228_002084 [Amoeboaphelidium protococcarum]